MRSARFFIFFTLVLPAHFSLAHPATDSTTIARNVAHAYQIFLAHTDSSIAIARRSLNDAIESEHTFLEGYCYYVLSKAYWVRGNYRLSSEYGFKALKIYENSAYQYEWGESLLSLARTFIDLKNYDQGRVFLKNAFSLATKHANLRLLANCYREQSMLLTEIHEYDSALVFADKGLALFKTFNDSIGTSILLSRKAKVYFFLGQYEKSNFYNRRGMLLDRLLGNRRALGIAYYQAARNTFSLNQPDSAIYFLKQSIPLNQSLDNFPVLIGIHTLYAEIHLKKEKPLLAVEQLKLANQYKDSLYNIEKAGQVQEMQSLYELESKNKTIRQLGNKNALQEQHARNQRLLTALQWIAIILLAALILVLVRLRRIQSRTNAELYSKNKAIGLQKEEIQEQARSLQHLNQLKSKLFSVIGHDLRGPIASLHSLLEMLTSNHLTAEEFVMFSGKLKSNLGVTQRTLENLLSWSLSQMEGIRTEQTVVDIKTVTEEACRLLEELAAAKNITLENTITEPTEVLADPDQLQVILRNLLHNAIKFSKTNKSVMISAACDTTHCQLKIKDSGIGMTQDEITLITGSEHFTKVGTQQEKGTGLGLLLCKEFIDRNGGTLSIESNVGEGTEIAITLPLFTAGAQGRARDF